MKKTKWQGIACLFLASLMMGSSFAAPVAPKAPERGAAPTKQEAPKSPAPTPGNSEKVKSAPTQVEPTKPGQPAQPVQPTQPIKPAQPTQPTKPVQPVQPTKPAEPTQSAPATEKKVAPAAGEKKAPGQDEKEKKPFALDHFKMIVCSLKQLGMEDQEIAASIKQGKKLEDILKENKISAKKFKRCMMKQYSKAVDVGVKEGQLTKEQAKQLKAALKETVDKWLPKK